MSATGTLRYALRTLRGNPGFAAIAILSLALGIGVNTAIFSLVDQLLLWSVPAREPENLVLIKGGRSMTYPFFVEYRDRNQVFSAMLASSDAVPVGLRPQEAPAVETGKVNYVSGRYFETLGVGAAAGRVIVNSDDLKTGGSPVAVLSYSYWQRRFAGDLHVIGRKLAIAGYPTEIVGVAEKGFGGLFNGREVDAFLPLTMYPLVNPAAAQIWNSPNMHWLNSMARLKPGLSLEQAQAGMRVLWPQVVEAVNDATLKRGGQSRTYDKEDPITLKPGAHGLGSGRTELLDPLKALTLATGLVLLIACGNVANLLLARASGRRQEIAVRMAVGATRARLVRQLLSESLVLALIGGALGFTLAYWGVTALAQAGVLSAEIHFRPNLAVVAFSLGVTLATAFLFGLTPALRSSRIGLTDAMKEGGATTQSGARFRLGKLLIGAQVALSLTLLVGAGLFVRTLRNLNHADIGFSRENVIIVDIDPTNLGYQGHRLRTFYDRLLEQAGRIQGVRSAALVSMTPMGQYARSRTFSAEGYQPKPGERLVAYSNPVTAGYFTTLGIPMLIGRDFRAQDEPAVTPRDNFLAGIGRASGGSNDKTSNQSRVCIVNESLARHLFTNASPLGRRISYDDRYSAEGALEIVGVVKDVHHGDVRQSDEIGIIYVPSWSEGAEARFLALRTQGDTGPLLSALRREVRDLDPDVPLLRTRTLGEYVNASLQRERLIAYLSSFFGLLALALASVGLYGVMAYAVTQRRKEVGIRMALGALRSDVVGMIVREAMVPVAAGIVVGLGTALALTRLVQGLLFGVAPGDPVSLAIGGLVLLVVALLAAAVPARRASRIEPLTALRHE